MWWPRDSVVIVCLDKERKPTMMNCGLDVGKKSSVFCIVDQNRKVRKQGTVRNRFDQLAKRFGSMEPMRIIIEASTKSFWLADRLEELGHDAIVVDPGRTKAIGAARIKHDKLDARVLAELGAADLLARVDRPSEKQRLERLVVVGRDVLVRTRVQMVNVVRSILDSEGMELRGCSTNGFVKAVREQWSELAEPMRLALEPVLQAIEKLTEQIAQCDQRIDERLSSDPEMQRLMTVDGVGPIVAASFLFAVRNAGRFDSGRQVGAYLGLVPSLYQSGKTYRRGRITKCGNRQARWALCVAANALLRTKRPSALKQWGLELAQRVGRKKAVVAVARKLASVMWSMLKNGRDFEPRVATA